MQLSQLPAIMWDATGPPTGDMLHEQSRTRAAAWLMQVTAYKRCMAQGWHNRDKVLPLHGCSSPEGGGDHDVGLGQVLLKLTVLALLVVCKHN